jgi:hypothetical protein
VYVVGPFESSVNCQLRLITHFTDPYLIGILSLVNGIMMRPSLS